MKFFRPRPFFSPGNSAAIAGEYREPELPPGVQEVRISVYKMKLTGAGFLDKKAASA